MTLRTQLSRVKDKLQPSMSSSVVYSIPYRCTYVGETTRRLEQRMREHQNACMQKRRLQLPNMRGRSNTHAYPMLWQETRVVDRASRYGGLRVKEALHPSNT